ncbi:MAG: ABC transporter substrate-binding protein, partial [Planctomycetes bacterium]|nr:ABC transporter substrate-binding protein [Planctomycetota bacterium]
VQPTDTAVPAPVKPTNTAAPAAPQVKAPIAYPDPNKLDVGGTPVKKLPIDQIVTYKSLPAYKQAAWLDKFVAAGTLPPVEKRLPKEPQVYLKTGMKDGIGVYGDLWRGFSACPTAGYNDMAGTTMGWFGIESYTSRYQSLIKTGPLYRADQDIIPMPELAKGWEWSGDGMTLTMHLVEGAFWSDGVPFNADDVMFTWEGYTLDANVNATFHQDAWTWDNKPATLEKVDDYTIKFTFPVAKPYDAFYLLAEDSWHVMPAHQLKPLHPKWSTANPKPTYKDFADALKPTSSLPLVTMGPWVITEYKTDELMIMRRNPYYWKVDEDGNQLPYMDEIQYRKGPSGIGRDLCTIAGDCDHMNLENPSTFVEAMTKAQDPSAKYNISWGPETLGYFISFNFSVDFGAQNDRDKAVRTLMRDLRFRQALSYATDRDGIAQSIMKGPFLRGWAGGLYPGAPDFDQKAVVYYPYDPDSAKALLAQIGLKDTNNDGILEWTSGSQAGQPVVLQLNASQDAKETQSVAEAAVNQWGAVGIKINMKILDSATGTDVGNAGTWDMTVNRGGQEFALPFKNPSALAPYTKNFGYHREGTTPRQMMDFEQSLVDTVTKYRSTFDVAGRKLLMTQYNKIVTQNVYFLGAFVGRYGLGTAKRVKNIADGTPVFMYQWVEDAILLDTLWTPADQQLKQNRPETIPVFKK